MPVTVTSLPVGPATGLRVIEAAGVTVNVAVSAAVALAALTGAGPVAALEGTVKVALNVPVELATTEVGDVGTEVPLKVIVTAALAG